MVLFITVVNCTYFIQVVYIYNYNINYIYVLYNYNINYIYVYIYAEYKSYIHATQTINMYNKNNTCAQYEPNRKL